MYCDFQTTTHGKWILTGEHAVIRGHGALVFPIEEKKLTLSYQNSTTALHASYEGETGSDTHLLFWSVIEQGMQLLGRSLNSLSGHFRLKSNIPIGVGMGASAALCVATARWFAAAHLLQENSIFPFAQQLEHLFHGQSSGLDIAGVAALTGIYFEQGQRIPLQQKWQPYLALSSCGQMGMTSHCIQQVNTLWETNPTQAKQIDKSMEESVYLARQALEHPTTNALHQLAHAINKAADCFIQWGLVSESLAHHIQKLREHGAIAIKPTGSGGGGYVISLWETMPPSITNMGLLPIQNTIL